MMFLVIWIGFEDLDWIGLDSLRVDWIWIWIVACRDWIDSTKLDWIFGFYQPLLPLESGALIRGRPHLWQHFWGKRWEERTIPRRERERELNYNLTDWHGVLYGRYAWYLVIMHAAWRVITPHYKSTLQRGQRVTTAWFRERESLSMQWDPPFDT